MKPERKREVMELVRRSPVTKKETVLELGLSASTFYRWQRRYRSEGEAGLVDRRPQPETIWNRLRPEEMEGILAAAGAEPDTRNRLLDQRSCGVQRFGIERVPRAETSRAGAGSERVGVSGRPEYTVKTTRVNQQWQSDASYFFVMGWSWYYLISVLDDYSRFILAWDLKMDMTAASISEVVEQAVGTTGLPEVPMEDRAWLLTDHGPGYLARAFEDYVRTLSVRHLLCSPHPPQTNGRRERFHHALKGRVNLLVYTSPEQLRAAMAEFIEFYNHRRYHEGIGNVTPADVYFGRREGILQRREEQKQRTVLRRIEYNLGCRQIQTTDELGPETIA